MAIVLDPNVDPVSYSQNQGSTWTLSYRNFTIHGVSACLSSNYGLREFETYTANNGILVDNNKVVVGGEINTDSNNKSNCWCKLTYPVVSGWWLKASNQEKQDCIDWCNWDWCNYWGFMSPESYGLLPVERRTRIFNSIQN